MNMQTAQPNKKLPALLFFAFIVLPTTSAVYAKPPESKQAPAAVVKSTTTTSPQTYSADGRAPLETIYAALSALGGNGLWELETVFTDNGLPAYVLHTRKKGPAIWLLAGIHGEEPAPPNAVYENLLKLNALAVKGRPIVLFPLCNPVGYAKNWRYPDVERYSEANLGHSVGDSEYLLPATQGKSREKPSSPQAAALTAKVLELAKTYPPVLSVDLHEDNLLDKGYIYSQGSKGAQDKAAQAIVGKMKELSYPVLLSGKTRFNEAIVDGIVAGVNDGSVDDLIAAETIILGGASAAGPYGKSVIVVETSAKEMPLKDRTAIHAAIIGILEELFVTADRKTP